MRLGKQHDSCACRGFGTARQLGQLGRAESHKPEVAGMSRHEGFPMDCITGFAWGTVEAFVRGTPLSNTEDV